MGKEEKVIVGVGGCLSAVLLLFFVGCGWYQAGVQSEVYRREGIHLSQWEVFQGAKPAERSVTVKDAK